MDDEYGEQEGTKFMNQDDSEDDEEFKDNRPGPEFSNMKKPSFSTNPIPKKIE